MTMVNQAFRIKIAYRRNYGGYMRRLRRLYEKEKKLKKPGIGRYPMGPTIMNPSFFFEIHSAFVFTTQHSHCPKKP